MEANLVTLKKLANKAPLAPRTALSAITAEGEAGQVIGFTADNELGVLSAVATSSSIQVETITLLAASWEQGEYEIFVPGVSDNENSQLIIPVPTKKSDDAYYKAGIRAKSAGDNLMLFIALNDSPKEDLIVKVIMFNLDGEEEEEKENDI